MTRILLNFIGGSIRWAYGTFWRTLVGKEKFTHHEYLYGPENSDDWFDEKGHQFNNRIIAILVIVAIFYIILNT